MDNIRDCFPLLSRTFYGKPLVYLDNAATSQKPQSVIDCQKEMSAQFNANIKRSVYRLADEATVRFEQARNFVAGYLNADPEEIIFTSGDTQAINLVAWSFGEIAVREGSEIIVTESEHHSNLVPWQMLAKRKKATLKFIPVSDNGELEVDKLRKMIGPRTAIICLAHISNVLGIINPIEEIVSLAHSKGVPVLVDGAQGIVHTRVDVKQLGCDFYAFSGHKVYAATGTGVLYARKEFIEKMPPFMTGGEMVDSVSVNATTFASGPEKFEAGTQNICSIPTLVPALQMAKEMESQKENIDEIRDYVYGYLLRDQRITLFGKPGNPGLKVPLFSFSIKGIQHEDAAQLLDKMGIAVRSGLMCAEPLMMRFGQRGMIRASFAPYNTMEEAEYFLKSLDKTINLLI